MKSENEVLVSVIIPVYNTEPYLNQCIQSVLTQTINTFEIIAINDGSTDGSEGILEKYKIKYNNFHVVTQDNKGLSEARNVGLRRASGRYIYFLDSDDFIDPNLLMKCYAAAEKEDAEIVLFDNDAFTDGTTEYADEYDRKDILPHGKVLTGMQYITNYYLKYQCPVAWLMFFRKDFLLDNNLLFLSDIIIHEDNEFHCRSMSYAQRVVYLPEKLYHRRYRIGSLTNVDFNAKEGMDLYEIAFKTHELGVGRPIAESVIFDEIAYQLLIMAYTQFASIKKSKCDWNLISDIESFAMELSMQSGNNRLSALTAKFAQMYDGVAYSESACKIIAMITKNIRKSAGKWLDDSNAVIGLYGKGQYAHRFIHFCDSYLEDIKASFVYIDSDEENGTLNAGDRRIIYNVKNLMESNISVIFTASKKYEEDMVQTIEQLYGNRFPLLRLHGELGF